MARIQGVDLPNNKVVLYALTYIYGIGRTRAQEILDRVGIVPTKRAKDLSEQESATLQKDIAAHYAVEGDLRKQVKEDIKRLIAIQSYRGTRHKKGLPARGQRTKTNARTRKGPRGAAVALKRKVTKK